MVNAMAVHFTLFLLSSLRLSPQVVAQKFSHSGHIIFEKIRQFLFLGRPESGQTWQASPDRQILSNLSVFTLLSPSPSEMIARVGSSPMEMEARDDIATSDRSNFKDLVSRHN
jgi:hypothetical protein